MKYPGGPSRLRLHYKFGRAINLVETKTITAILLQLLENRLEQHPYLAADHATIAHIAVYPFIALAPESNISLDLYPAVTVWLSQIQTLPGYVDMPGMWQST